MLPRGGGPVPLHLAAHLHPRAPALHAGHRVHPYPLHRGASVQLTAQAQGPAHRGGEAFGSGFSWLIVVICAVGSIGLHMTMGAPSVSFLKCISFFPSGSCG